jgi:hypothetical protein
MNRFAKDFEVVDAGITNRIGAVIQNIIGCLSVFVVIFSVTPAFLIAAVIICKIFKYPYPTFAWKLLTQVIYRRSVLFCCSNVYPLQS